MTNDIPIIFSAPMVRAFMEDRKTMTRRLAWRPARPSMIKCRHGFDTCPKCDAPKKSPWTRVKPGSRLWVREAWKPHSIYADRRPRDMPKSRVFYMADDKYEPSNVKGFPSIHMPRWASRLTLIVEANKVEPLQSISEEDALAEGIEFRDGCFGTWNPDGTMRCGGAHNAVEAFRCLWTNLHGSGSWSSNPEVVALTLRVIKANIDEVSPPHKTHTGALARSV